MCLCLRFWPRLRFTTVRSLCPWCKWWSIHLSLRIFSLLFAIRSMPLYISATWSESLCFIRPRRGHEAEFIYRQHVAGWLHAPGANDTEKVRFRDRFRIRRDYRRWVAIPRLHSFSVCVYSFFISEHKLSWFTPYIS